MKSVFFGLLLGSLCACVDDPRYAELDVEVVAAPPTDIVIRSHEFDLVVATAVKIAVKPESNGPRYGSHVRVVLTPQDASMLDVFETDEARTFVLVGLKAGDTCVEVTVDGDDEECIPVHIHSDE